MENTAVPLHYQITQDLRKRLEAGEWKVGDLFPTDKQLMEKYEVSSTTVRRAIYELVKDGWLSRKPGKGTYVQDKMVETLQRLTGFFEEVQAKGMKPSALVVRAEEIEVDENMTELIPELKEYGDVNKLFLIEKVQKMNDMPVVLVRSFWPLEVGREIAKRDLIGRGMYEILQNELGIVLDEASQIISAAVADENDAAHLEIAVGSPMLTMQRITYSNGRPMEVSVNSYRSDRYSYRVVLNRNEIKAREGVLLDN